LFFPHLLEEAADELSCRAHFHITFFKRFGDRMLKEIGRAVLEDYRVPDRLGGFYAESIGNVLAGYIVRDHANARPRILPKNALNDEELRIVRRFIEERIETGFNVAELAGAVGLRPQQFALRLKLAAGLSPWQYVEAQRLSAASLL
jgi:transcriptional regulator GlxA family with amidase domain